MSEVNCLIETFSHKSIISRVSKSNISIKSSLSGDAITISIKGNKGLQDLFISKQLSIKLDLDQSNTIIIIPEYKVQITINNLDATTTDKLKDEIESRSSNKENNIPTNTTIQRQNLSLSKHRLSSFPLTPKKTSSTLNTKQHPTHNNTISPRQGKGKKDRSPTHNTGYTPPANKRPIIQTSPGKLNKSLFKSNTSTTACRSEPPAPCTAPTVELTDTQQDILKTCCETATNVFFTGCAGTGKSFLLKRIISQLYKIHGKDSVYITATTGLAACAINGVTIHQFAGIMVQQDDEASASNSTSVISKVCAVTFIINVYTQYITYIYMHILYRHCRTERWYEDCDKRKS